MCDGAYQPCRPARKGATRHNYDELIVHLGKAHVGKGWSVLDGDGKLDVDETALATFKLYESRPKPPSAPLIPNFQPFSAMAGDTHEWSDYGTKLGEKVNDTFKAVKKTKDNEHLWEAFDRTSEKVRIARVGDHGPYLYQAALEKLGGAMAIYQQDLGKNPVTGEMWKTVDWEETALKAKAKGIMDAEKQIHDFLNVFYHGGQAREHYQVIHSYERVAAASVECWKGETL